MFEKYLEDPEIYRNLEEFFVEFFKSKLNELRINGDDYTVGYYRTTFSNGDPFMDGNPIFSVRNAGNGNILKIVIEDGNELVSYDSVKESGVERVVVGGVCMLDEIKIKTAEWIEEQS